MKLLSVSDVFVYKFHIYRNDRKNIEINFHLVCTRSINQKYNSIKSIT